MTPTLIVWAVGVAAFLCGVVAGRWLVMLLGAQRAARGRMDMEVDFHVDANGNAFFDCNVKGRSNLHAFRARGRVTLSRTEAEEIARTILNRGGRA